MPKPILLAVCFALIAGACASSSSTSAPLTIYSGRSEELIGPLIADFEARSGIEVSARYGDSAELAATILEEGDRSPASVFLAQDPASLGSVALAGLFSPLETELLDRVPDEFSDRDGLWVGVSGRARSVVYDPSMIPPGDLPPTESGLVDDQWAGRVGIAPTNGSFLAFVAAKILIDGEASTLSWLEAMNANQSPTFPKNSTIVSAVADGQVETGLVNHYYALRLLAEDPSAAVANAFFAEACAGSLVMPAGAGILASTNSQASAEAFLAYLLSAEAQEYFAQETFEYPLVPGVAPSGDLPPIDSIPAPAINLSDLAPMLDVATDLVAEAGLL